MDERLVLRMTDITRNAWVVRDPDTMALVEIPPYSVQITEDRKHCFARWADVKAQSGRETKIP